MIGAMFGTTFKAIGEVAMGIGHVAGLVAGVGCDVTKAVGCTALKVGEAVVIPAAKTVASIVVKK
jgi:hypothetical protein